MYFENIKSRSIVWQRDQDFAVNSTRSQQSWIEDIGSICSHDNLNGIQNFKAIQLIKKPTITKLPVMVTRSSDHTRRRR